MPKKHLFAGCIALGLAMGIGAAPVMAQSSPPVAVNAPDIQESFLQKTVRTHAFELQTSQLALERTNTPAVRTMAEQIIKDRSKAKDDLAVLLKSAGITEPSAALEPGQIQEIKLMQGAQNQDFDRIYINAMNNARADSIASYRSFAAAGSPSEVRGWAAKTLPSLEQQKIASN